MHISCFFSSSLCLLSHDRETSDDWRSSDDELNILYTLKLNNWNDVSYTCIEDDFIGWRFEHFAVFVITGRLEKIYLKIKCWSAIWWTWTWTWTCGYDYPEIVSAGVDTKGARHLHITRNENTIARHFVSITLLIKIKYKHIVGCTNISKRTTLPSIRVYWLPVWYCLLLIMLFNIIESLKYQYDCCITFNKLK